MRPRFLDRIERQHRRPGITLRNDASFIAGWLSAGAAGFGSELFRPNYTLVEIEQRARQLVQTLQEARSRLDRRAVWTAP
jgi:hypothetical protein